MTDKELYGLMLNDDRLEQLEDAEHELSIELAKPIADQDYARIDELIRLIKQLNSEEENTEQITQQGLEKLHQTISNQKRSRIRRIWATAVSTCAVLLLGSNICSYSVYGINAFSAAYQILNGGITIDFSQSQAQKPGPGNDYTKEMRDLCEQNGIDALIPSYIPSGFSPTDGFGSTVFLDDYTQIGFYYKKSKAKLIIEITEYRSEDSPAMIGIPTDSYNIKEETVCGNTVYILKEDKQYSAVFKKGKIQYLVAADGVDYDECYHVLISLFQ